MVKKVVWLHELAWGNPYKTPPNGQPQVLISIESDSQTPIPEISEKIISGNGWTYRLTCNREIARWSEERKSKAKRTREKNRILKEAPLFAEELIERFEE
jgi:hypothetical protein